MTALDALRAAGLQVRAEGEYLKVRGQLSDELKGLALANKPQILADLVEEQAVVALYSCPRCHVMDYCPVGNGKRRCLRCGQVYRDSHDVVAVAVHLEQVDDAGHRAWRLVGLNGRSPGLFATAAGAREWAAAHGIVVEDRP